MNRKKNKLQWNVLYEDFNKREILWDNIFEHFSFMKDVKAAKKKYSNNDEFLKAVKGSLQYYFWAKCEHEVIVESLFYKEGDFKLKLDAYEQVMQNWDAFSEYLLAHKSEI